MGTLIPIHYRDYIAKDKVAVGGKLLKRVVDALQVKLILTDTISRGDTKFMGVVKAKGQAYFRLINIRILPADQGSNSKENNSKLRF